VRPGGKDLRPVEAQASDTTGVDWGRGPHRFVFASDLNGNNDIFVMNRSGSKLWRLTYSSAADIQPNWWSRPVLTS
jgi:hypothetical protein